MILGNITLTWERKRAAGLKAFDTDIATAVTAHFANHTLREM